jgi:hypothetical protein
VAGRPVSSALIGSTSREGAAKRCAIAEAASERASQAGTAGTMTPESDATVWEGLEAAPRDTATVAARAAEAEACTEAAAAWVDAGCSMPAAAQQLSAPTLGRSAAPTTDEEDCEEEEVWRVVSPSGSRRRSGTGGGAVREAVVRTEAGAAGRPPGIGLVRSCRYLAVTEAAEPWLTTEAPLLLLLPAPAPAPAPAWNGPRDEASVPGAAAELAVRNRWRVAAPDATTDNEEEEDAAAAAPALAETMPTPPTIGPRRATTADR